MTNRQNICVHADSEGNIWSLRPGQDIKAFDVTNAPVADYFVVGFPENYLAITELFYELSTKQKIQKDEISNIYVGSVFPWKKSIHESKYFLYELITLPSCKKQFADWHRLNEKSIDSYLVARGLYHQVPEITEIAWQDHCLYSVFNEIGAPEINSCAKQFVSDVVDPRWFVDAKGRLNSLKRYFGFGIGLDEPSYFRQDMLFSLYGCLLKDSFLVQEAKTRIKEKNYCDVTSLCLNFVARYWLSHQTSIKFFDADVFFTDRKAKRAYLKKFG